MKKKETALALAAVDLNNVPTYLEQVRDAIKAIKGSDNDENQTNGELEPFGNIFQIKEPTKLIQAVSMVQGREEGYKKAAKAMGIAKPAPFKIGGAGSTKWISDLTKRYNVVTQQAKLTKLEAVKKELEANLSAEMKLAASMQNIKDILDA